MKIRHGWVSNSSSSSFICDVCGSAESGYDISLEDCQMCECENGHMFCTSHLLLKNITEEFRKELFKDYSEEEKENYKDEINDSIEHFRNHFINVMYSIDDFEWFVPKELCPICMMESFKDQDLVDYLIKTNPNILSNIKKQFKSYKEFKSFIKE